MDRDQLGARFTAAIRRHARSLADNDMRATRPLLDDLAAIAVEYARAVTIQDVLAAVTGYKIGEHVYHPDDVMVMMQPAGTPPLVAADTEVPAGVPPTMPPAGAPPRPRARTRTRGGAK